MSSTKTKARMISTENISKKYKNDFALKEVSTTLPTGKIVAFIGSNGAGKSTVLNIISRLISPSTGNVYIDGRKIAQWETEELAKKLTILGQSLHSEARITVKDLVGFGRFPHSKGNMDAKDKKAVEDALAITGIEELKDRFIDELSGGQRQMAYIAMSIAQDTQYILLDEPLNNLDMGRAVKIMKIMQHLVKEKSKTVFMVVHDINFVSFYADYVLAFKNGELKYQGKTDSIMKSEILSDIYDIEISVENYRGKKICIYYK